MTILFLFVALFALMFIGVPVAVSLGLAGSLTILLFSPDSVTSLAIKLPCPRICTSESMTPGSCMQRGMHLAFAKNELSLECGRDGRRHSEPAAPPRADPAVGQRNGAVHTPSAYAAVSFMRELRLRGSHS